MTSRFLALSTLGAAVASGLVGGVFLAFSSFVMGALARLPAAQGIAAMQAINIEVVPSAFLALFGATGVLAAALGVAGVLGAASDRPGSVTLIAASASYLVLVVGTTMVCNVPRNDALMLLDATTREAAQAWAEYLASWTAWNHVRTVGGFAAAALFATALLARR